MYKRQEFWSGLGGAHSNWASHDPDMRDVVQILEVARDNYESHESAKSAGIIEEDPDDDDDDVDSSDDEADHKERPEDHKERSDIQKERPDSMLRSTNGDDQHKRDKDGDNNDGGGKSKQNIFDSAKDYKKHMKSEHRRNRGLMQWKVSCRVCFFWSWSND